MARSIRLTVSMKIAPSHEVIHLAYLYTRAKQRVLDWLVKNKPRASKIRKNYKQFSTMSGMRN